MGKSGLRGGYNLSQQINQLLAGRSLWRGEKGWPLRSELGL